MRAIALLLSLVFIFILPWEGVVDIPGVGTGSKLFGFAVAAFWLVTIIITRRLRKPGPFQVAVILFVLWNATSVFWSRNPSRTVEQLVTWAQLLVLVFILWDLYTTRETVVAGLQAYVLGAYVAIGGAFVNYLQGNAYYTHYQRFATGDAHPDGFGFILALGIPVAWYLAQSSSSQKIGPWLKVVNYAFIPIGFIGIALSGTRSALIAAAPAMVFGLASLTRLRLWARVAISLFFIFAVLFMIPYLQTLRSFQRFSTIPSEITEGDLNDRTIIWSEGLTSFANHPLIGVGSNMFRTVNNFGKLAHNTYLSVLVELGLVGFILFGIILTIAVIQALRLPKWDSIFWLTTLLVWAIGAFTLTYEYRKATWLFLSLLIANAALIHYRDEAVSLAPQDEYAGEFVWQAK